MGAAAEMRDAGVDIEAHTVSHHDLRHATEGAEYTTWLQYMKFMAARKPGNLSWELRSSLSAFSLGFHNEVVRKTAKEGRYEMQFTVYGRQWVSNVPCDKLGGTPSIL